MLSYRLQADCLVSMGGTTVLEVWGTKVFRERKIFFSLYPTFDIVQGTVDGCPHHVPLSHVPLPVTEWGGYIRPGGAAPACKYSASVTFCSHVFIHCIILLTQ